MYYLFSTGNAPSVSLTVQGGVSLVGPHCPGTVRLFCEGVELVSLRWRYNGSGLIESFNTDDIPTNVTPSNLAFRNVELVGATQFTNPRFANFTSILTVDLTQLQQQNVAELDCGDPRTFDNVPVSLHPNVPSKPNVTAVTVTYQSVSMLIIFEVTWKRLVRSCFCQSVALGDLCVMFLGV